MSRTIDTPWALTPEQVLAAAATHPDGLNPAAAARRLADFGRNMLAATDREPWHFILLQQFANPLVYMLIGAACLAALYFKSRLPQGGRRFGLTGAAVVLLLLLI